MRLPYAPPDPQSHPDPSPTTISIYTRIATRRAPRPVTKLDRALLHNPQIADGWNSFLGAIRSATTLDQGLAELAICRIAVLNGAVYEWSAHAPLALKAGVSRAALSACLSAAVFAGLATEGLSGEEAEGSHGTLREGRDSRLSAQQWAVVNYTDAMTRGIVVPDRVFRALGTWFDDRQVVELTATVAGYNCVSRFLVALDVCEMNGGVMEVPREE